MKYVGGIIDWWTLIEGISSAVRSRVRRVDDLSGWSMMTRVVRTADPTVLHVAEDLRLRNIDHATA